MHIPLGLVALAIAGFAASADIVPVECIRSSQTAINGTDAAGDFVTQSVSERSFPAYPLDHAILVSQLSRPGGITSAEALTGSRFFDGETMLRASLAVSARTDPYPTGTVSAGGSATLMFTFDVTEPTAISFWNRLSAERHNTVSYVEAVISVFHDGQLAASWYVNGAGEQSNTVTMNLGVGSWRVQGLCHAGANSTYSSLPQQTRASLEIDIRAVPTPAAAWIIGLATLLVARRRTR
jgi:hypothetical protein